MSSVYYSKLTESLTYLKVNVLGRAYQKIRVALLSIAFSQCPGASFLVEIKPIISPDIGHAHSKHCCHPLTEIVIAVDSTLDLAGVEDGHHVLAFCHLTHCNKIQVFDIMSFF